MSRPYFTARHLESMALLPETLEIGRVYFIDDAQVIVVDHGKGPVIYGGVPGPQGEPGEPLPQIQEQIDTLSGAILNLTKIIWEINQGQSSTNLLQTTPQTLEDTPQTEGTYGSAWTIEG